VLIGVRGLAADMVSAARESGMERAVFAEDSSTAGDILADDLRTGDLVLVKGSRGVRTEKVIERLLEKFVLETD
jgi:UDP-N-acetylmuramoyl-tripeptide--D-alanyl-D-alanine ligase